MSIPNVMPAIENTIDTSSDGVLEFAVFFLHVTLNNTTKN